jgi:quercetin dioxygenase-like cupin family protein
MSTLPSETRAVDVLGPTIEFLTSLSELGAVYCVLRGTLPPGVAVPLHSHADPESFFQLAGTVQLLLPLEDQLRWVEKGAGDFVHIPGGTKHAFRNTSDRPVVQLIMTTPRLATFFREAGRPLSAGTALPPPTAEDVRRFAALSATYGYWLGTPAENEALGIPVDLGPTPPQSR